MELVRCGQSRNGVLRVKLYDFLIDLIRTGESNVTNMIQRR